MSLRVWLPLNGNINNQGASDVTVTNSNATVDTSGKIGSCYSFNGSTSCIELSYSNFPAILNGDFSICLWIYNNDNSNRSIFFGNYGLTGSFFNIEKTVNNTIRFYWNGTPDLTLSNTIITASTWNHLVITRQENIVKFYINGTLTNTSSTTLTGNIPSNATIFRLGRDNRSDATAFNGKLNDFRLYDHCLSNKEVKEISRGLICHYPLDCNGIGVPNLVDNSATFSDWTAADGWTLGTSNNGMKMYSFSRTGATSSAWNRLIPTLRVDGNDYPNGISVSMDLLTPDKSAINHKCLGALQTYDATGARTGWYEPSWDLTNVVNNQWSRIKFTFTQSALLTNHQGLTYSFTKFSFQLVQNGNISIRKIKIEEGSVATPYSISVNDMNSNIETDTSGYENNGTKGGDISFVTDSARYSACTLFNGSNTFIACGRGGMVKDEITVNLWAYESDWSSFTRPISCTEGGGWNFENNGGYIQFPVGTGTSSNTYKTAKMTIALSSLDSGWHMLTGTYDGLLVKIYLDGELQATTTAYTTKTPMFYNGSNGIFIGSEAGGNPTTPVGPYFNGKISDVRIYATALSADDILELYNSSASISNNGSIMCYDFVEQ